MNRDRFSGAGRFPRYLFSATKFLIFFALIAFVVTCSFLLFLDSMRLDPDILRENALLTFLNILLLSALFTVIDGIRRRLTVERPVRRIRAATQRIIQGDFSVRIEPLHGPSVPTPSTPSLRISTRWPGSFPAWKRCAQTSSPMFHTS